MLPKINSAHGSGTRNIINAAIDSINVQGKSIQDLVAEGQLTPEQYAELITTVNGMIKSGDVDKFDLSKDLQTEINRLRDKINKGDVSLNDLRPDVLSAINNGDGTPFEILSVPRDKSVTPEKTTFIESSTNLYDEKKGISGKAISRQNGQLVDGANVTTSPFYDVVPGETYTVTPFWGVAFYDSSGNYMTTLEQAVRPEGFTFDVRAGASSMRLDYRPANGIPQINKGSKLLPYERHYKSLIDIETNYELHNGEVQSKHIKDGAVSAEKTDFIQMSTNLYDEKKDKIDNNIYNRSGELIADDGFVATRKYTTSGNESFSIKRFSRVVFFDENDDFISLIEYNLTENTNGVTFITPEDSRSFAFHYQKNHNAVPQLNKGSEVLPYEPYYFNIPGLKTSVENSSEVNPHDIYDYVFNAEDVPLNFIAPQNDYERLSLTDVQAGWEDLFARFPKYFTKTILGKDTTGEHDIIKVKASEDEYDGDITNREGSRGNLVGKKPKVAFIAGIHGHEETSVLAPYHLFKMICEDWENDEVLEYLRFSVDFEFIPIVYPHGYDTGEYSNVTGINLQTNFPYNFSPRNPDSNVYGGEEPLTEIETIYCKEFIDDNTDAVFFADLHSAGYTEDFAENVDNLFYYLKGRDDQYNYDVDVVTKNAVEFNTRLIKKEYNLPNEKFLAHVTIRDSNGGADAYAYSVGLPALVMELPKQFPGETLSYGPNAMKSSIEVLTNNFLLFLKHFRDKQKGAL